MSDQQHVPTGIQHKSFSVAEFKAMDSAKGEFEALVSVFGNVDYGGDRVVKGAFSKSLNRFKESGKRIPVIYSHDNGNLNHWIGGADPDDAVETDDGLVVKGQLFMDDPHGRKAFRLMEERLLTEFSFAYNVVDAEQKNGAYELKELDLIEVGPTLRGMNPATELLAVKSFVEAEREVLAPLAATFSPDDAAAVKRSSVLLAAQLEADEKAGARLSKETRSAITQAIDLLSSLISTDDTSSVDATPVKSDEAEASGKASVQDQDDIWLETLRLKEL